MSPRFALFATLLMLAPLAHGAEPAPDVEVAPLLFEEDVVVAEEQLAGPRNWVRADYLLWWIEPDRTPVPLLTTGPNVMGGGALGNPGTQVLFGSELDYGSHSGGRLDLGHWFGGEQRLGFAMRGFMLETHTIHGKADSDANGSPLIARPFYNTFRDAQAVNQITRPGSLVGGVDVFADSRLWGADAAFLGNLRRSETLRFDVLAGFAYLGQKDELRFSQSSAQTVPGALTFLGTPVLAPGIISIRDFYRTVNQFYGAQLGGKAQWQRGRLFVDSGVRFGLGSTRQEAMVSGYTILTDAAGANIFAPGGLYTQPTNIGFHTRSQFAFTTEVDLRLGFQIARWLQAHIGYSFLYWSDVARPGGLVNPYVDARQIASRPNFGAPGTPVQPVFNFNSDDFWAQGLTAGLTIRY
ncbi:MAG: BBP7 family outer membrane beta-barrel protein [Gemmataceae bacterium]